MLLIYPFCLHVKNLMQYNTVTILTHFEQICLYIMHIVYIYFICLSKMKLNNTLTRL